MAYETGGGGGKAPGFTENPQFSLAKPGDLTDLSDPGQIALLDEMLQQLYESNRLLYTTLLAGGVIGSSGAASTGTGDVVGPASAVDDRLASFDTTTGKLIQDSGYTIATLLAAAGKLKYATVTLSETDLEALGVASFVELVPAAANIGIHPVDLVFDNDVTDAYTNTPTWSLKRNSGAGNNQITAISLTYSTGPRRQTYRTAMTANTDGSADFIGTNIGIEFSAALTGVGAATTRVHLWYTTFSTT